MLILIISLGENNLFAQVKASTIAFASDTQEPMWIEKIFLKSDRNLEATRRIFQDVYITHPAALFLLGDVVSLGKRKGAWINIDRYINEARQDSIPVFATLGNHEIMFNKKKGIENFKSRFSTYDPSGFTETIDSVAVVLLNSNFSAMTKTEIERQNNWYQNELKTLDSNSSIKSIVICCHHSPFTNSKIVRPSLAVQENFVPPYIESKKSLLFLSGHSHNFERFKIKGKYFLVIGGGGGLHQPLKDNNQTMHDLSPDYKPAFHYLEIKRIQNKLHVVSRRLKSDFSSFDNGLSFTVSP